MTRLISEHQEDATGQMSVDDYCSMVDLEQAMAEREFIDGLLFVSLIVGSTVVSATLISLLVRAFGWWV
jgi:hypothetical protein